MTELCVNCILCTQAAIWVYGKLCGFLFLGIGLRWVSKFSSCLPFMKKLPSLLLFDCKSLKLQGPREWISGVLRASLISFSRVQSSAGQFRPLIFPHNGRLGRFAPLCVSGPRRAPPPAFVLMSGGGWRPFYVAGSATALKALVRIKYATLCHSRALSARRDD